MQNLARVISFTTAAFAFQITQQPGNMSPNVLKLEGSYTGATPVYLQFFDSLGAPANTTVPLYEEFLGTVAPNGFSWQFNPGLIIRLNNILQDTLPLTKGLILCLSTTQGALTLATGSNKTSLYVSLEEWENLPANAASVVGDTTTHVRFLVAWSDGEIHYIDKIIVSNTSATPYYLMLFTQNLSGTNTVLPWYTWYITGNQPLTELNYRGCGFTPMTQDITTSPPTISTGCYLRQSTTPGTLTIPGTTDLTIQCVFTNQIGA